MLDGKFDYLKMYPQNFPQILFENAIVTKTEDCIQLLKSLNNLRTSKCKRQDYTTSPKSYWFDDSHMKPKDSRKEESLVL